MWRPGGAHFDSFMVLALLILGPLLFFRDGIGALCPPLDLYSEGAGRIKSGRYALLMYLDIFIRNLPDFLPSLVINMLYHMSKDRCNPRFFVPGGPGSGRLIKISEGA